MSKCLVVLRIVTVCRRIFVFALNVSFLEPYSKTFTSCSAEKVFKDLYIENTLFNRSILRSENSLYCKKW